MATSLSAGRPSIDPPGRLPGGEPDGLGVDVGVRRPLAHGLEGGDGLAELLPGLGVLGHQGQRGRRRTGLNQGQGRRGPSGPATRRRPDRRPPIPTGPPPPPAWPTGSRWTRAVPCWPPGARRSTPAADVSTMNTATAPGSTRAGTRTASAIMPDGTQAFDTGEGPTVAVPLGHHRRERGGTAQLDQGGGEDGLARHHTGEPPTALVLGAELGDRRRPRPPGSRRWGRRPRSGRWPRPTGRSPGSPARRRRRPRAGRSPAVRRRPTRPRASGRTGHPPVRPRTDAVARGVARSVKIRSASSRTASCSSLKEKSMVSVSSSSRS